MLKGIGLYIGALVVLMATAAILDYSGLIWESHIGVKRENVRRSIFEETKSYRDGKIQDLVRYRHEYTSADTLGKKAIASTVRQAFAGFDDKDLAPELRQFLSQCNFQ